MSNSNPNFFFGEVPTVDNWDGYFGDKVDGTGGTLDSGFVTGSTIDATSTVEVLVPGSTTARTLAERFADTFNVGDLGAIGDRKEYSAALTCLAGANPILTIAGADLSAVVPGQLVVMPLGGLGGGVTAPAAISAAAWLAKVVTVTTGAPHNIPLGQTIQATIAGCTPDAYNGAFAVTPTSTSTFTYTLVKDPTALTVAGTWVPVTAGAKAIVGSVVGSQIVLTGTVSTTLTNIGFQATGNPTIGAAGTGVSPLDIYTLAGGEFPTQVTVQTTKVVTLAINTHGSGGVDGTYTFVGKSLAATPVQFTGTITGGVLASVSAPTVGGIYQANPANINAEPIVDVGSVSGLTGATVTLVMGANNVQIQNQPASISCITVPGGRSSVPTNPVASTGPGSGVTFNVSWTAPTVVIGTDNTTSINAASAATLSNGAVDATGRRAAFGTLVFPSDGDFLVGGPLNFTGMSRLTIDGQRSRIYSCAAGKPIFDEQGSAAIKNVNMTITGDPTFPPRWPFQIGRISNTITAPANTFDQLILEGTFADAGFMYNFCSEAINTGLIRGGFIAPYGIIEDACNSTFWNVTSDFITNTSTPDHVQSFLGGPSGKVSLVNHHPNGCGIWMLGGIDHNYNNSYFYCQQDVFCIIVSTMTPVATGLLAQNCHVEQARHLVSLRKGPTGGYGTPQFSRFVYSDAACAITEHMFDVTEPGIVNARFFNTQITVLLTSPAAKYFDDPSVVTFSGIVMGGDGASQRWLSNTPADMTGIVIATGIDAPEFFAYNLMAQDATLINGALSINGGIQAAGAIGASDGTVASISITASGLYQNPDFPTVTIDASPGVSATAVVIGMQWFSDVHIIAPGTGYAVNDVVTLVGGTHSVVAKLHVTGVDGSGAVTSFAGFDPGRYSVYPPVGATTTTGGSGAGLVINPLQWGVAQDGTGVTITAAGSGYTSFPDFTFSTPTSGASAARGSVVMGVAASMDSVGVHSHALQTSTSYANDGAAAAGGVALAQFYRNGSVVQIRVT